MKKEKITNIVEKNTRKKKNQIVPLKRDERNVIKCEPKSKLS